MPRNPSPPAHAPGRRADAPPIVSRVTHATFGLWFPFFRWLVLRLPPEWVARLAAATAERAIWAREPVREAILENHAALLGLPPWRREVEESALAMLGHHSRSWIDLLRFSARPPADLDAVVPRRVGTEHLVAARDAGRGAILLTAHVGNFEIGGFFLGAIGLKVAVVYLPDPSPVVERDRTAARDRLGIRSLPMTSEFSAVKILRSLEEGYFVAIQGDRDYAGTGRTLPFLGRSVSFPSDRSGSPPRPGSLCFRCSSCARTAGPTAPSSRRRSGSRRRPAGRGRKRRRPPCWNSSRSWSGRSGNTASSGTCSPASGSGRSDERVRWNAPC